MVTDGGGAEGPSLGTKPELRAALLAGRSARPAAARAAAADALAGVVCAAPEVRAAHTVAAYVGIGTEPGTLPLLDRLRSAGVRVLLPVLCPDLDLDWAGYAGAGALAVAARGLREPEGPRLGREAVREADVVVVPALAVDHRGVRLGRGGGSYDRVLARVPPGRPVVALLYAGEVLVRLPADPHDRPVNAAATPEGWLRLPLPGPTGVAQCPA